MTMISKLSSKDVTELESKIMQLEGQYKTLAEAAQQYMSILYDELKESIVLTRLFATVSFKDLPQSNKEFVMTLAHSSGVSKQIEEETLILSLLGTRGAKSEWNDCSQSKGHIGIPLVSSDFIDRVPMISRLLNQLGAEIDWIDGTNTKLLPNVFKGIGGVFYVRDAETEVDHKGRKVIVSQDFVKEEKVKTVFGIGGCYVNTSLFFTNIIFLREYIDQKRAEQFMLQASKFKIATMGLVVSGRIFE